MTYNPNSPNVFPIMKQSLDDLQHSKTMSNIFLRKKLVKSMSQAPTYRKLIRRSKFESQHKNRDVKNYGKNCFSCSYVLKVSLYQFKRKNKAFFLKNSLNFQSSNLCCY